MKKLNSTTLTAPQISHLKGANIDVLNTIVEIARKTGISAHDLYQGLCREYNTFKEEYSFYTFEVYLKQLSALGFITVSGGAVAVNFEQPLLNFTRYLDLNTLFIKQRAFLDDIDVFKLKSFLNLFKAEEGIYHLFTKENLFQLNKATNESLIFDNVDAFGEFLLGLIDLYVLGTSVSGIYYIHPFFTSSVFLQELNARIFKMMANGRAPNTYKKHEELDQRDLQNIAAIVTSFPKEDGFFSPAKLENIYQTLNSCSSIAELLSDYGFNYYIQQSVSLGFLRIDDDKLEVVDDGSWQIQILDGKLALYIDNKNEQVNVSIKESEQCMQTIDTKPNVDLMDEIDCRRRQSLLMSTFEPQLVSIVVNMLNRVYAATQFDIFKEYESKYAPKENVLNFSWFNSILNIFVAEKFLFLGENAYFSINGYYSINQAGLFGKDYFVDPMRSPAVVIEKQKDPLLSIKVLGAEYTLEELRSIHNELCATIPPKLLPEPSAFIKVTYTVSGKHLSATEAFELKHKLYLLLNPSV